MPSEFVRAIRYKSASQVSGGRPFLTRAEFVSSKVFCSIGLASSKFEATATTETTDAADVDGLTRRGRVVAGPALMSLATGGVSTPCPWATQQTTRHAKIAAINRSRCSR